MKNCAIILLMMMPGLLNSAAAQQYDWNKESQKQREKDNAAYIEAMKPEKKKQAGNASGSGSDTYYDNIAAADRKKREDAMSAEYKARYLKKVEHFERMSSHVPKVKENFGVLMVLATDAYLSEDEAYSINRYLSPNSRTYDRFKRTIFYPPYVPPASSAAPKEYTPEEAAQAKKVMAEARVRDSINQIKQDIEKQQQKKLEFHLYKSSSAYARKDYAAACLYFDSGQAWKDLTQSSFHNFIVTAGKAARYLGDFEKSMAILLKYNYDRETPTGTAYPAYASELLKYEASISAVYAGDFNKAIALGSYHTGKSGEFALEYNLRNYKSDNISFLTSYGNFHLKTADAATQLVNLPYYIDDKSDWSARLVRMYFLLKTNNTKKLKEQMKLFAKTHQDMEYKGDVDLKLANMLYSESKRLMTEDEVPIQALYLLDLAIDLLPANKEFLQTRYNTNTALKRTKFAEADAKVLGL